MFHDIEPRIQKRMRYLERLDGRHRRGGVPHFDRLRQVPPATGKFLALLAASAPPGAYLEIGTSGGYSTLWLALACRVAGRKLTTFEIAEPKIALARETLRTAGIEDVVELIPGDACKNIARYRDIAFCFLDAEKDLYLDIYEKVVPRMVSGGILVADNVISHRETLGPMVRTVLADERMDAQVVPIGSGELVCRRI